jgi:apolipoprotein N-acyltransferase
MRKTPDSPPGGALQWLLPAGSALLLAAAFPPLHLVVPSFVGLAPFAVWVARLPDDPGGAAASARGGFVFGVVLHGILLHWVVPALAWVTPLALPVFLAMLALLSGLTALFGAALHRAVHVHRLPIWLALPVTWTAVEWLQGHLPGALAFPWLGLGTSLTGFPELVGIAELVGARGVTFWLALANGVVASLFVVAGRARSTGATPRRPLERVAGVLALTGVVVLPAVWGVVRAATLETRPVARLAVVHMDVPAARRADPGAWHEAARAALGAVAPALTGADVDLVILPEGVLVEDAAGAGAFTDELEALAASAAAPVLFGAYVSGGDGAPRNTAHLVGRSEPGDYRYEKRRLVPVVETALLLGGGQSRGVELGGFLPGEDQELLQVGGSAFGVLICYEAAFARDARAQTRAGAEVLLNLTNDGWFGAAGPSGRMALHQHAAHLIMRAVESRRGAARAANGGFAYFVDPVGRLHDAAAPGETGVKVATVLTSDVTTFHTRYGDLVGPVSALALLLLLLRRRRGGPAVGR